MGIMLSSLVQYSGNKRCTGVWIGLLRDTVWTADEWKTFSDAAQKALDGLPAYGEVMSIVASKTVSR